MEELIRINVLPAIHSVRLALDQIQLNVIPAILDIFRVEAAAQKLFV